jgi:hypothetical protein
MIKKHFLVKTFYPQEVVDKIYYTTNIRAAKLERALIWFKRFKKKANYF